MNRPPTVALALKLIWAMLAVIAVNSLLTLWDIALGRSDAASLVAMLGAVVVVALGLFAWLQLKIGAGRNWARTVFIVLILLSTLSVVQNVSRQFQESLVHGVLSAVSYVMAYASVALLMTKSANAWFSSHGADGAA